MQYSRTATEHTSLNGKGVTAGMPELAPPAPAPCSLVPDAAEVPDVPS
ncbi:MAG TPA: hypothetical protein VER96_16490 [Polyangiaceae bacterium]|nr:hypothetical protein [Polyangiaceae bacterium]